MQLDNNNVGSVIALTSIIMFHFFAYVLIAKVESTYDIEKVEEIFKKIILFA